MSFKKSDLAKIKKTFKGLNVATGGFILRKAMAKVGIDIEAALKLNTARRGFFRHPSGQLARSIQSKIVITPKSVTAIIGSGVRTGRRIPYANIQETGGTIRAKNSKYLTIPLDAAKTSGGRAKKTSARAYSDTFVRKTNGNLIIFQKRGKRAVPLFLLKEKVSIPGTKYMSSTLAEKNVRIGQILVNTVNEEAFR